MNKINYCKIQNIELLTNSVIKNCIHVREFFYKKSYPLKTDFKNRFNNYFYRIFNNQLLLTGR